MRDFRELKVWEKAHRLTLEVYQVTISFPREEQYGLMSQLRRCSSSIPANIAEGCGRGSEAEFAHFLQIALGSASELDYHLLLAYDLQYLKETEYKRLAMEISEIKRMLAGFLQKLRADG